MRGRALRAEFAFGGRGWARQRGPGVVAQGRAPFAGKRTPAQSRRWLPPLPSGPTPKIERPGDLRCSGLPGGPPGCPPTPNADMGGARPGPGGRGAGGVGREMEIRTSHPVLPCPALPCRVESPLQCTARYQVRVRVPCIFLLRLWPYHRSNMEPIDPSHPPARPRKTPRRLYQPRGPPIHLIPADSPFALMFPRHSCVISTASLRSILTASTSPTRALHSRSTPSPTSQRPPPASALLDRRSRPRLTTSILGYIEVYDPLSTCEEDQGIS